MALVALVAPRGCRGVRAKRLGTGPSGGVRWLGGQIGHGTHWELRGIVVDVAVVEFVVGVADLMVNSIGSCLSGKGGRWIVLHKM